MYLCIAYRQYAPHTISMHILDSIQLKKALNESHYKTIGNLAKALGVHRNSVSDYFNGKSIFSEVLEKLFEALRLSPRDLIKCTNKEAPSLIVN